MSKNLPHMLTFSEAIPSFCREQVCEKFFFFFCARAFLSGSLITFRNGFDYPILMERETLHLFNKLKILTFTGLVISFKKLMLTSKKLIQVLTHSFKL